MVGICTALVQHLAVTARPPLNRGPFSRAGRDTCGNLRYRDIQKSTGEHVTASTRHIRFRKVETPAALRAERVTATYEVLVDGKAEGHVDKYVYGEMTNPGGQYGRGQRSRMVTTWGWRRPGVRGDATGYDRRGEAADWLVRSLGGAS